MGQRKIGARTLSIEEIKLILPTYEKLLEQIKEIRISNYTGNYDSKDMQKTNNIAILGERGSGKSSVLKTIFQYLNKLNTDNERQSGKKTYITFPIIIPENMSESSNLIATILGLFKGELNQINAKYAKNQGCCIENKPSSLELEYNKLIKRYCYIQKEFRDVLVSEFTTENDYVKKSSEIFISDIEFIDAFNAFINQLIKDEAYEENPLIVFFIDDIDLSTIRCSDIVKTLLSYISHKNIITFISGDLNTFEEALTINFLRQEKALEKDLLKESFLEDGSKLLDRKKLLSYEYLKKVIPPVYRHNVKKWSLADRGNYCIKEDDSNPKKMADLLTSTLGNYIQKSYFKYISFEENREVEKPIPQMFNILDKTSRGLNNVYNLLLDTKDILTQKDSENNQYDKFIAIKMLIETIISSNPVLNNYREMLLGQVINFGTDFQSTVIRVDNFFAIVFVKKTDSNNPETGKNIPTAATQFSLFVFLDLSIRLLKQSSILSDVVYRNTYQMTIALLINNPTISDSSVVITDEMVKFEEKSKFNNLKLDSNLSTSETGENIIKVLENASFPFSLTLYQYLSQHGYNIFNHSDINDDYGYILNVYDSYRSLAKLDNMHIEKVISEAATLIGRIFSEFNNLINPDNLRNTVRKVFSVIIQSKKLFNENNPPMSQTLMTNFLTSVIDGLLFEEELLVPINKRRDDYLVLSRQLQKNKEVLVLLEINHKNLWGDFEVDRVNSFVLNKMYVILKKLSSGNFKIDVSTIAASYNKFMNDTYKGASYTKAKDLASTLRELMPNLDINNAENFLELGVYIQVREAVQKLASNSYVWYGNPEARSMLYAMDNAKYVFLDEFDNEVVEYKELQMWMHFYATYYAYNNNMEQIYLESGKLATFNNLIRQVENMSEQADMTNFIVKLNEGSEYQMNINEFEQLFPRKV